MAQHLQFTHSVEWLTARATGAGGRRSPLIFAALLLSGCLAHTPAPIEDQATLRLSLACDEPALDISLTTPLETTRSRARPGDTRFGLRHDSTGIGGIGQFFLILPETSKPYRVHIEWGRTSCSDESAMAFAPRDFTGPLNALNGAVFFVGRPKLTHVGQFHAAWFGTPSFDTELASRWAAKAFDAERRFFDDRSTEPYQLFMRVLPELGDRSNGMGQLNSFLSSMGPNATWSTKVRINIAHEMLHRWLGLTIRLPGPEGTAYWFSEGFTVHYAATLMHREQLISTDEFLAEINSIASRHLANPHRAVSNEAIAAGFFENDVLSVLPYTRGALYAAELDADLRRASKNQRSLDTLIRVLAIEPDFRKALRAELGQAGVDRFEAVIINGTAQPEPSYGPCFERVDGVWRALTTPCAAR